MKKLILALILAGTAARAQDMTMSVSEQCQRVMSCYAVSVASAGNVGLGATLMLNSTNTASGIIISTNSMIRSIAIQNRDSSVNIFCSDSINVSSQPATAFFSSTGFEIQGSASVFNAVAFNLIPNEQWYCVNDSTTKAVNTTVCACR